MPTLQTNRLLESLGETACDSLRPYLHPVTLKARARLDGNSRTLEYVYFVLSGIVSLIHRSRTGFQVDVGIVGYEGCTGCNVILGVPHSPQLTTVQVPGEALRINATDLWKCMDDNIIIRINLLRYVHTAMMQRGETALSASIAKIDQRVARWLLMAHDRVREKDIEMTHELLAEMLGVRRSGVIKAGARGAVSIIIS